MDLKTVLHSEVSQIQTNISPTYSFPGGSVVNSPANAGDLGLKPGLGRSSGEGNGNPFQYSCLGNPMDREASSP